MRRRELLTLLGGGVMTTCPFAAWAQQQAMPVIGFLSSRSPAESTSVVAAFRDGLREGGFAEGKNVIIAFRWADSLYDHLPALAAELVDMRVAVLFAAGGPPSAFAAKTATLTIPIVFSAVNDPVSLGLVTSLNRPGGNVTGMSILSSELAAKNVQLLKELIPAVEVIAYLVNPLSPSVGLYIEQAATAANALGITVPVIKASTDRDVEDAFASLAKVGAGGLVVPAEPFFDSHRDLLVALAARYAVPMIAPFREYVVAGGLMSYGASLPDSYRRAGIYVTRVLKGEKPADLPVMQPTEFDLVLNLKTAKALGLTVPQSLLIRAHEVIE
jgi:putative tryptophan/tyrosine transport system substrate-binding protein